MTSALHTGRCRDVETALRLKVRLDSFELLLVFQSIHILTVILLPGGFCSESVQQKHPETNGGDAFSGIGE